jgi:hypothetical protein
MADSTPKPMTHIAWAYKPVRVGRTVSGYWLEIGRARHDEGDDDGDRVYLDRTPIGGWTGAIRLKPIGAGPPQPPKQKPLRPAQQQPTGDEGDDQEPFGE